MEKSKKILALLLVCLMIFTVVSCGGGGNGGGNDTPAASPSADNPAGNSPGGSSPGESSPGGNTGNADSGRELNVAVTQDSGTLYPIGSAGNWVTAIYCIYDALLDTYPDGTRRWILAEGIDPIDEIHSTMRIRKGVTFSNGNPLTADDVLFSMELYSKDPTFGLVTKVVDFSKTAVIDDYTIDLWYTNYNASQEVGLCQCWIMDKESFDEISMATNPIGTGPYVVKDYVVNSHLSLEAREDYWGGAPTIKNLNLKVINETSQIINAIETGEVDAAAIPIKDVNYVRDIGYDVEVIAGGGASTVSYNMSPDSPLASKEARWAISMAIDRQAIADLLYGGLSSVPAYPASHAATDFEPRFANIHEIYSVGYNPDRARELAEQAGLVGKTLRIVTNGADDYITIAEIMMENLRDIGITVEIVNYEMASYFSVINDPTAWDIAMATTSTPSALASDALGMYLMFNPQGWSGPDYSDYMALSAKALGTFDPAQASEYLYQTIVMFEDFCPWYALCETMYSRAKVPELKGVQYMLAQNVYYQDVYWG